MIIGYGDKGFERAVSVFERKVIREIKRIIAETAEMAVSQMKALAPVGGVDGGNLKGSIEVEYYNGGLSARIIVGAFYGIYVEYGTGIYAEHPTIPGRKDPWVYFKDGRYYFTRGMRPQPFFHPSLEVAFKHFRDEMNKIG
jgi:HK97 gp10 family phage protein